jgi:CheY-like chemotaxis protein
MAAIGMLAAGVAHEFNNIWSAVHGYAELAKTNSAFLNDLVDVTLEQAERASEIIKSLLSFSDKRIELRSGVRLGHILRGVSQLVEMELKAKSIEFELTIHANPDIMGSEGQLQQIFLNLVINASHAIGNHGKISISLDCVDDMAVVKVTDTGHGMDEEHQSHIFDPFFTTKGALGGKDKADGHGLGLTLTYNLIQTHKGTIEVESEPGAGTTFTVSIPVAVHTETDSSTPLKAIEDIPENIKMKFLVIDDEILLQGLISSILAKHEVTSVSSGEEALKALEENTFDAIFLDIVLEGEMDGFEVFEKMSAKYSSIPVILITGRTEDARIPENLNRFSSYIQKPFKMNDIANAIKKIIEIKNES